MGAGQLIAILRRVLLVAERPAQEHSDQQLLELFVTRNDEAAFAALVERHGRLVFGVCQSVLGNEHDTEDAFQATFLVLARMAGSIRQRASVVSWLYGVALRTALKARRARNTRRRHERESPPRPSASPATEAAGRELESILCEEIGCLPEKYRAPLVLCCLQGKSRTEAAQELGWKEGTVSSRIANARALLEVRLTRRGVVVPAALTAVTLVPTMASAAVPVELSVGVAQAAVLFATGKVVETVSVGAVALAEGVLRALLVAKLKMVSAALLVLVLSAGLLVHSILSSPVPTVDSSKAINPIQIVASSTVAPPKRQDHTRVTLLRRMPAFRIDGGGLQGSLTSESYQPVIFSPDGTMLVFGEYRQVEKVGYVHTLHVQNTNTGKELWTRKGNFRAAAFSPDQKMLAVGHGQQVYLLNPTTGTLLQTFTIQKQRPLLQWEEPRGPRESLFGGGRYLDLRGLAFSPDGKSLAVLSHEEGIFQLRPTTHQLLDLVPQFDLFEVATGRVLRQTQGAGGAAYRFFGFSQDGKILAWEDLLGQRLDRLVDLHTAKVLLSLGYHDQNVRTAAVSPDGKRCVWGGTKYTDWTMKLWDLEQDRQVGQHRIQHGTLNGLVFSRDGAFFISLSADGIKMWNTATGQELRQFRGPEQNTESLALSPDGKRLATGGLDGTVFLWDVPSGKFKEQLLKERGWISSVCFSPDGRFLVAAHDCPNERGQANPEAILWRMPGGSE